MSKIQVTSVEMRSQAQVIVLDASFVAKAVRAQCAMSQVTRKTFGVDREAMLKQVDEFITELVDAFLNEEPEPEPVHDAEVICHDDDND